MAYLGDFDATSVAPSDFSALPSGTYSAIISNSEMKLSKSGDQYLSLTIEIIDGTHKGRLIWQSLNLNHANPKVVDIAQRELSAICHATGKLRIKDSAELHNIPVLIKLDYIPPKDDGKGGQWPEKNQIKKWEALSSRTPTVSPTSAFKAPPSVQQVIKQARTATPAPANPHAPPTTPVKPWANRASAAPAVETIDDDVSF